MGDVKAIYWFAESGFPIERIDSKLYTHIFCGFAKLNSETNQLVISPNHQHYFSSFTPTVQQKNPNVKTLISIGGGGINTTAYANMASQPGTRRTFIDSSIKLARAYGFHGLDLDWEFPLDNTQMANLGKLVDEWRVAVEAEHRSSGKEVLLLTAAVSFGPILWGGRSYPYPSIARSLDWINVMSYDFYSPVDRGDDEKSLTRAPAALFDRTSNVSGSYGLNAWIQAGVPANKLVLGIPFYGIGWRLVNPNAHGLNAKANGPAGPGDSTFEYHKIRNMIQNGAGHDFNDIVVTNYCYAGTTWIGYDDTESVETKVIYVRSNRFRGYFAWHVGADLNDELSRAGS
ncbi:class V chitinase-like [Impatiens glandulifera]|uniref:class V chitinase-like n=1 Tax=Impatiens glandulifera TaxID=253017 RepID=UPI001FB194F8|nr:class V chitinase-like [Impatiens glandulifera]